jgi:isocitrate lyase
MSCRTASRPASTSPAYTAKYTAKIMRADMAAYDADPANYTQSLGCWHGFIGQQKLISIKKHFGTTKGRYLYLSGWMIAALRSEFGPLPDQSMHEKTSVPALIEELYTFLRRPMPANWA